MLRDQRVQGKGYQPLYGPSVHVICETKHKIAGREPRRWRLLQMFLVCLLIMSSIVALLLLFNSAEVVRGRALKRLWEQDTVISCYYNMPGLNMSHQLLPTDIHPYLCTHINAAFARVEDNQISLDDVQCKALLDIVRLKKINPKLKILLSIGGSNNDNGFSEMVIDHASRKTFIKSIKSILRNFMLDGVDLDWEFPALGKGRQRQHFSQLLREIRVEYEREKRNYLLTVAVAAPETIVDVAYDVDQLNMYVDFVNMMTYDFHHYTRVTPFTGFNSPLYARQTEQLYMSTLNINYTAHMYMERGLDRDKIVVGIPTYGHTFKLVNEGNTDVGAPASGYGSLGDSGFVNYPDICTYLKRFGSEVQIKRDDAAKVPYLYKDREWVSYDNPQSAADKASYIAENDLRGAMIYSLNSDDYGGVCGETVGGGDGGAFPLARAVRDALRRDSDGRRP